MLTGSIIGDIKYQFRYGNMVVKLIFVNIGVFLFFKLFFLGGYVFQSFTLYNTILEHLEAPASIHRLATQPWSLLTYMFLHTGFLHIIFNMLWLFWFGEIFVLYLSDKKVFPLYIIGGLAGAATYILAYNLLPVFRPHVEGALLLGASASIYAIVFAAAVINPDHSVSLLFLGNVKLKYLAVVPLLIDLLSIPSGNAGGYIAHVGGALSGAVYMKGLQNGFDIAWPFVQVYNGIGGLFGRKSKVKVTYRSAENQNLRTKARDKNDQEKVDDILDKIARSGYDSLSKDEKDFLFHYSKK